MAAPVQLIIDTDPGVDDALAIFMAFNSPEVQVLGLTTIFGNVTTAMATANALHLCEMGGRADLPVAQGPPGPLKGGVVERGSDFVNGDDGAGQRAGARGVELSWAQGWATPAWPPPLARPAAAPPPSSWWTPWLRSRAR